jgi:AraC-like DNA-binding protein
MTVRAPRIRFVRRAGRVYVEQGLGDPGVSLHGLALECGFRVDRLSARLGLSGRHFQRLFQDALGMSPKEWLKAQRMVEARHLLRQGGAVKEIAMDLGYSQTATFSREFQQTYGVPPTTFVSQCAVHAS